MSTMLEDSPAVLQAYEEFKRFSADPAMREKVRARERFLIDQRLQIAGARREGKAEGITEGLSQGLTEGRSEKARETAQLMKNEGFDIAIIAKMTGLPPEEINKLSNN